MTSAAPCKFRPRGIKDGIVRYHRSEHNDRAIYECDFGFKLVGDSYLLCQYGDWVSVTGEPTGCEPSQFIFIVD